MANKRYVTIIDIADKLNLTASTVSRALHNNPGISAATKKAILKTAKDLNYQPHEIAAALRNGKSCFIGMIVPTADRTFFGSIIREVEEVANNLNYKVIICQSYDDYKKEVQAINALFSARVDGIIACIGKNTVDFSHFKRAIERSIALLLFDRTTEDLDVNQVAIDDHWGACKIVEHLIQQGCKRIAHFTGPRNLSIFQERLSGYKDALDNHGIPFDKELVIESNLQLLDGRKSMQKLLKLKKLPDAVFSASDYGAMGALQVLKERKIQVPQEIALAGFSNDPFTSFTDPSMTTVDQLSKTIGNITAKLFFEQLKAKSFLDYVPQKIVLKPELVIRESSLRMNRQE